MPNPFSLALQSAFGAATSAVSAAATDLANFLLKIDEIVKRWDDIKTAWDQIFEEQDVDEKLNQRVTTVSNAQSVIEELRIGNLKERAEKIYNDIKDLIQLVLHPLGGSEAGDQAILSGAAAFAGGKSPTGAFKAASLFNTAIAFGNNVLKIEDKILEIIQLLDLLDEMKMKIEAGALPQKSNQILMDGHRKRV